MITHKVAQGSLEWLMLRVGKPTASEFDNIISPTGKVREGKMFDSYVASKLAEAWTGTPNSDFNSFAMDQGQLLETEAIPWLSLELGSDVERVGFITTDDGRAGCSPDGLLGSVGVEVKCPQRTNQVKYLLDGIVPEEYRMQIQGGMFVTGFKEWLFVSYSRRFPKLVLTVKRNDDIQEAISLALEAFYFEFDEGLKQLIELNGGPPKRFVRPAPQPEPQFESAMPS